MSYVKVFVMLKIVTKKIRVNDQRIKAGVLSVKVCCEKGHDSV